MGAIAMMLSGAAAGGGGGATLPNTILGSKLIAWYRRGVGIYDNTVGGSLCTFDGQEVGRWEDQTGNGYHGVRTTALNDGHLQYYTTSATYLSAPVINFGGSFAYMRLPDALFTALFAQSDCELMIALRPNSNPCQPWCLGNGGFETNFPYSNSHIYDDFMNNARPDMGVPPTTSFAWIVYNIASKNADLTSWWNGSQWYTSASNTLTKPTTNTGCFGGKIGSGFSGALFISEAIFIAPRATSGERSSLYTYFTSP